MRAKLPFGDGTWPAIWTLGKNINEDGAYWDNQGFGTTSWPACGEIDIMEHGLGPVNHTSSAIHTPSSFGATVNYDSQEISDVANNFHIYSVNWSPNQITFLVDDVGFYTYNPSNKDASTWPFDADQYILLNIAMGGVAGSIDPSFTQSPMQIDYVRVYQNTALSVESKILKDLKVYPNPASNIIHIDSSQPIDTIEIFSSLGLKVKEYDATDQIDVKSLSAGIYLLKAWSNDQFGVKRIIVK